MGMNSMVSPDPTSKCNHGGAGVAARGVQLHAGKRRHELDLRESMVSRLGLAMLEQHRADAAACVIGSTKKARIFAA